MSAFAQRGRRRLREAKGATAMPGKSRRKVSISGVLRTENLFHRLFVSHVMLREHAIRGEDDDFSVQCQQREII